MDFLEIIGSGDGAREPGPGMAEVVDVQRVSLPGKPFECQLKDTLRGRGKRGIMTS